MTVEDDRLGREAVEVRRVNAVVPVRAEMVAAERVGDDDDDVHASSAATYSRARSVTAP